MSTERQIKAAAQAILNTPGDYPGQDEGQAWAEMLARAALRAAHPLITTVAELDAMPDGSVILSEQGGVWMKGGCRWFEPGDDIGTRSSGIALSATVLHWGEQ